MGSVGQPPKTAATTPATLDELTVYVKAGVDGKRMGACPFCQRVFMVLLIKSQHNLLKFKVGKYMQRMTLFLFLVIIPNHLLMQCPFSDANSSCLLINFQSRELLVIVSHPKKSSKFKAHLLHFNELDPETERKYSNNDTPSMSQNIIQ